jgi:hypothetical protein
MFLQYVSIVNAEQILITVACLNKQKRRFLFRPQIILFVKILNSVS